MGGATCGICGAVSFYLRLSEAMEGRGGAGSGLGSSLIPLAFVSGARAEAGDKRERG